MNLSDLRAELADRASETDDRHGDLLPGVRRKITTTKRRRAAGAVGALAVVAVVAFSIIPGGADSGDPDPIQNPPTHLPEDITQHDVTFPGVADGDLLQHAVVGDYGQGTVEFDWTPVSDALTVRPLCSSINPHRQVRVTVDDLTVLHRSCNGSITPVDGTTVAASDTLWLRIDVGRPARVRVELTDAAGRPVIEPLTQVGVGLYRTGPRATLNAMPSTPYQPDRADYEKNGIRYRGVVGGDRLEKAAVGDTGQSVLTETVFPSTTDLVFRTLCLAQDAYVATLTVDGKEVSSIDCGPGDSTDAGTAGGVAREPGRGWPDLITVGAPHTVMLALHDRAGRPAKSDRVVLGFGIYQQGPSEIVDGTALPSLREVNGHLYELADLRTQPATSKELTIPTPGGTPYLLSYGSTANLGAGSFRFALVENGTADGPDIDGPAGGVSTVERTARPAGSATLRVTRGRPTTGKLILAIYMPVR
jgi:hypothetical protein